MTIQNIICDIDGVLMHDNVAVPGAAEFIKRILDTVSYTHLTLPTTF